MKNKMPVLLKKELASDGIHLQENRRLTLASLSAELNLDSLNKASITLNRDDPSLKMHDLVEVFRGDESLGIYRVVKTGRKFKVHRKYDLNHAFDILNDSKIANFSTMSGTVADVMAIALAHQKKKIGNAPYWQIGTVECTAPYSYDNKYNTVYDVFSSIRDKFEDYYYEFDFTTFPWTVSFLAKTNEIESELRLNRNINDIDVNENDTNLCTRLYMSIDSTNDPSVPESERTIIYQTYDDTGAQTDFGIVEKSIGIQTQEHPDPAAYAADFFSKFNHPDLSISISGEDFSKYTGESIDKPHLGALCATILAEYQTIFIERIVSISFRDLLNAQDIFTLSLANKTKNASGSINELNKKSEAISQEIESIQAEVEESFSNTLAIISELDASLSTQIELLAETVEGLSVCYVTVAGIQGEVEELNAEVEENSEILDQAGMSLDESGNIHYGGGAGSVRGMAEEVTQDGIDSFVEDKDHGLYSHIMQEANQIRAEVSDTVCGVYSSITQTAGEIRAEVHEQGSNYYSALTMEANQIRSEVGNKISDVYSSITEEASQIRAEVHEQGSNYYSALTVTANSIKSEVGNKLSDVYSSITEEANQIRAEVHEQGSNYYSALTVTANSIKTEVGNKLSDVYASITTEANQIRAEVHEQGSSYYAALQTTANGIKSEVGNTLSGYYSELQQASNAIKLVVNMDNPSNPYIKAAEIAAEINKDGSTVKINANRIKIGESGSSTITLNDRVSINSNGDLQVTGNICTSLTGSEYVQTKNLKLVGSSSSQGANIQTLGASDVQDMIIKAQVDTTTNTLYLWKLGDNTSSTSGASITFSKATALTAEWTSSGNDNLFPLTVKASEQLKKTIGFTSSENVHLTIVDDSSNAPTLHGNSKYSLDVPFLVKEYTGSTTTEKRYSGTLYSIDASAAFNSDHSMVAVKYVSSSGSYVPITAESINVGDTITVYPYFDKIGTGFQLGTGVTITANDIAHSVYGTKYVSSSGSYVPTTSETIDPGSSITIYPTYEKVDGTEQRGTGITVTANPSTGDYTGIAAKTSGNTVEASTTSSQTSVTIGINAGTRGSNGKRTVYATANGTVFNGAYEEITDYKDGWEAAEDDAYLPSSGNTATDYMTAYKPSSSVNGSRISREYTVSVDSYYGYIKTYVNGVNTTVARVSHNYRYTQAEYDAALASLPSGLSIHVPSNATSANAAASYKTVTLLQNGSYTSISNTVWTPWFDYDDSATVTQGTLAEGRRLKLHWGDSVLGVWLVPSSGGVTVNNWSLSQFESDSNYDDSRDLPIKVSVQVNGTTYNHTFTKSIRAVKVGDDKCLLKTGTVTFARLNFVSS